MSQHSQRTQRGPSVASIAGTGVAALAAVVASTLVVWMPSEPDWWHIAGAAGWTVLAWMLTGQAVVRHVERRAAEDRAERAITKIQRERALNTGTWEGEVPGEVLTIRYEPRDGSYWAEGWISDHWQIRPETVWSDRATLVHTLRELERSGEMTPWEDEGTRAVRARLDIDPEGDGYPQEVQEDHTEAAEHWASGGEDPARTAVLEGIRADLGVEDTRRLSRPQYGPSPAALTPINVPVFRTETERAAWAAEHEIPTEFLPRP
ncbi:Pas72 [Actinoplanes phage phiAsp2]|uniref:Pas72 n=1 Tax=Actinoplanes phage phiAsp2 TaxID=279303 RepID=Q6J7V9_9CAUD|nr:Pas72 [Actinoplanes phage phiAsp2]AAT36820.1 Pas72 [Actinoplanes phage phiAsp2]